MMKLSRCRTLYKTVSWVMIVFFLFSTWGGVVPPALAITDGTVSSSVYEQVYNPAESSSNAATTASDNSIPTPILENSENTDQDVGSTTNELPATTTVTPVTPTIDDNTNPTIDAVNSMSLTTDAPDAEPESVPSSSPTDSSPSHGHNIPSTNGPTTLIFDGYNTVGAHFN